MAPLSQKSRALWWYIRHPRYYREFLRVSTIEIKRLWRPRVQDEAAKAREWCSVNVVSVSEAFEMMGIAEQSQPFEEQWKEQLRQAHEREKQCPVKMGGGSDLALLFHLTESIKAQTVIETGVAYGWSSLAFLLSLKQRNNSRLISTDKPYPGAGNEQFVGCVVPSDLYDHWTIFRETDRTGLPKAISLARNIDLCHYDSDKSYDGRMWAYPLLWNILRSGGLFISDDIGDNLAFRDFCEKINEPPIVVRSGERFIGLIIKMGKNNF